MAFLRFESVSFAYPGARHRALDGVTFSLEEGEYTVVCGESGCGKTTLLRQAKPGLIPAGAREGRVLYRGTPLPELDRELGAMKIGFVQQNPDSQIVTETVWQELAFGLENMGLPAPVIRRRVGEMASFFGMEGWFRRKTCQLSGGQKQILNLASVMAMDPELLILDEPSSMLDPLAARSLLSMVLRINRELGVAVLLCEHRLEEVFQDADSILLLREGKVLVKDDPEKVAEALHREPGASRIYYGLPAAVRIFGELRREGICPAGKGLPLSVRDARRAVGKMLRPGGEGQFFEKGQVSGEGDRSGEGQLAGNVAESERRGRKPSVGSLFGKRAQKGENPLGKPVLEGRGLWFRYEEKSPDVLRGLDIALHEGERLALLGGNGAGKSTLLKLLCGVKKPLRGKVTSGKGKRIAMLPQNPQALFSCDSLWEELLLSAKGDGARARQMAIQLDLEDKLPSHPFDLSGGELQRAAIGKLLLADARILLLDEPTKGMDAYLKQELAEYLEHLSRQGASMLIVTHDLEFAAACAHRCAMIFDGQILSEDEPHAFFAGNRFYTTAAGLIAGEAAPGAVTCEEVIDTCRKVLGKDRGPGKETFVPGTGKRGEGV